MIFEIWYESLLFWSLLVSPVFLFVFVLRRYNCYYHYFHCSRRDELTNNLKKRKKRNANFRRKPPKKTNSKNWRITLLIWWTIIYLFMFVLFCFVIAVCVSCQVWIFPLMASIHTVFFSVHPNKERNWKKKKKESKIEQNQTIRYEKRRKKKVKATGDSYLSWRTKKIKIFKS